MSKLHDAVREMVRAVVFEEIPSISEEADFAADKITGRLSELLEAAEEMRKCLSKFKATNDWDAAVAGIVGKA